MSAMNPAGVLSSQSSPHSTSQCLNSGLNNNAAFTICGHAPHVDDDIDLSIPLRLPEPPRLRRPSCTPSGPNIHGCSPPRAVDGETTPRPVPERQAVHCSQQEPHLTHGSNMAFSKRQSRGPAPYRARAVLDHTTVESPSHNTIASVLDHKANPSTDSHYSADVAYEIAFNFDDTSAFEPKLPPDLSKPPLPPKCPLPKSPVLRPSAPPVPPKIAVPPKIVIPRKPVLGSSNYIVSPKQSSPKPRLSESSSSAGSWPSIASMTSTNSYQLDSPDTQNTVMTPGGISDLTDSEFRLALPSDEHDKPDLSGLTFHHFSQCTEPWALSTLTRWLRDLFQNARSIDHADVLHVIELLIEHHMPMSNASHLSRVISRRLRNEGVILKDGQEVSFSSLNPVGVICQMTGHGCYSSRVHLLHVVDALESQCYSKHCTHRLITSDRSSGFKSFFLEGDRLWHQAWPIRGSALSAIDKNVTEYQNIIHELLASVNSICEQYTFVRTRLFWFLPPAYYMFDNHDRYRLKLLGYFAALEQVTIDHLLLPLFYRVTQQGPFVKGISDIMMSFVRKGTSAYIKAVAARGLSDYLFKRFQELDPVFKRDTEDLLCRHKLEWSTLNSFCFSFGPKRGEIMKRLAKVCPDPEEKAALNSAVKKWDTYIEELDRAQAACENATALKILAWKIRIAPEYAHCKLDIEDEERELIYDGEFLCHFSDDSSLKERRVIVLDNYTIFARFDRRKGDTQIHTYSVEHEPIPTSLIAIENAEDQVSPLALVGKTPKKLGNRRGNLLSPTPKHAKSASASNLLQPHHSGDYQLDIYLYPFKIKYLGEETYTFYASEASDRETLYENLKKAHCKNVLFGDRYDEPFRVNIISRFAFYPDSDPQPKAVAFQATALDDCIDDIEEKDAELLARHEPDQRTFIKSREPITLNPPNPLDPEGPPSKTLSECGTVSFFSLGHSSFGEKSSGVVKPGVLFVKRSRKLSVFEVSKACSQDQNASSRQFTIHKYKELKQSIDAFNGDLRPDGVYIIAPTGLHKYMEETKTWKTNLKPKSRVYFESQGTYNYKPEKSARLEKKKFLDRLVICYRTCLLAYEGWALRMDPEVLSGEKHIYTYTAQAKSVCVYGRYIIAIGDDIVQILDSLDGRLVQVIVGRDIRLLDDGRRNYPHRDPKIYSLEESDRFDYGGSTGSLQRTVKIGMQHPRDNRRQIIFELLLR
ncbi:Ras- protein Rab6 [Ascosphaera pollenicola]|nr:Ras- protein Rab6 [Ascosphaera pollenicola]